MYLRHIEPGSDDWWDATEVDARGFEPLSPEEILRLRMLLAREHATMGMPIPRFGWHDVDVQRPQHAHPLQHGAPLSRRAVATHAAR